MGIGNLFYTSWTLIFLCICPWAYTQEGLIHEYKIAVFARSAYKQGALYTVGGLYTGGANRWVNTALKLNEV